MKFMAKYPGVKTITHMVLAENVYMNSLWTNLYKRSFVYYLEEICRTLLYNETIGIVIKFE